jgi:glycosyltransferase involved in cell wall biosynthesis
MEISVILCTYNRCQSLFKALESLAASRLPESVNWQVLVVDNNSPDQTRAVVEDYCRRYPGRFRYLFEPRQGKSYALNSGIRESRGDVIAFVDDDVTVDPNWLHHLTTMLTNREWAGAGGRILPEAGFMPPLWMDTKGRYALAPLAMFDLGLEAGELREAPVGTNMAFQREVFSKYGDFRTDLGPQPGSEIRNEDAEFGFRLLAEGERFWYEPSAVVYHSVPENRIRKAYFLAWWCDKGRADLRQHGIAQGTKWFVGGVPLYLFRRLAVWTLRWMIGFNSRRRFSSKLKVWSLAGAIRECYRNSMVAAQGVDNKSTTSIASTTPAPHE